MANETVHGLLSTGNNKLVSRYDSSVVTGALRKSSGIASNTAEYKLFLLGLKSKNFLTDPSRIKV
jgi:hypothetical protein